MAGFSTQTTIAHDPHTVFAFATDPHKASQVMADIVRIEPLHEPLDAVGGRWRETRAAKGKEHSVDLEVVQLEAGALYAVACQAEGFDIVYRFTFEPTEGGTHVQLACEVSASGMKKMMAPMVAMALKKQDGDHLERLKAALG